jgi:outer membrane protein assembly factor BamB
MMGWHAGVLTRALAFALIGALAACATSDKPKPKPLEPLTPQIAGRQVWSQRIDSSNFPTAVAVNAGVFTVAGGDGTVVAMQADTGRELWRGSVGSKLSAGVGSDGKVAAVVTRDGKLVALDAGRVLWQKPLAVRVTTAPLVAGARVFVLGTDRSVQAFDAQGGEKLWTVQRPSDPLTLAQAGVIAAFKDTLIVGQGARMAGLEPRDGSVKFDVAVASPRGTNEVERLADLVAPASRVGDVICARSFQAAVGCVNAERGTLNWTRVTGGTNGVAADEQTVFSADASDRISAWKAVTGEVLWTSDKLMHRGLSAPLIVGKAVVFGDADGTLHFLSRDKGEAVLRLPTDGSAILSAPVLSGITMLVVTKAGGVFAFRPE